MAKNKLILCVCGAGINTSNNACMTIKELLEKEGVTDYEVKFLQIDQMSPYKGRENMVVVWMTQIDPTFGSPSIQGLPYLIGGKKAKIETTHKIVELMNQIYKAD